MNRDVTVDALGVEIEPWRCNRTEPGMELRHFSVTRVAELGDALMRKHMAVRRAMGAVAGCAAFYPRRCMFKDERATFIVVAAHALLLPESAKQRATFARMRIVARGALERAFSQPMSLIESEVRYGLSMTSDTQRRTAGEACQLCRLYRLSQQTGCGTSGAMLAVTARTREPRQRVSTVPDLGMRITMTGQTAVVLNARRFVSEREHIVETAAGADVISDVTVTIQATRSVSCPLLPFNLVKEIVRVPDSGLELVTMTCCAKRRCLI